jgi:hypothetical protein
MVERLGSAVVGLALARAIGRVGEVVLWEKERVSSWGKRERRGREEDGRCDDRKTSTSRGPWMRGRRRKGWGGGEEKGEMD